MYHPDVEDTPEANKIFSIIQELYHISSGSYSSASVKCYCIFRDKDTKKGFELNNPVQINNGTCTVYHTATKIVLIYKKQFKKFYENYLNNINGIKYADDKMEQVFKRTFPKVVKNFETTDGDFVILMDKASEVLNLGLIVASYNKRGTPFPERQAGWIMNRLFNFAMYMSYYNKVYNGLSLSDLWVSPEFHSLLPIGGWDYTTLIGDKMIGCPKERV